MIKPVHSLLLILAAFLAIGPLRAQSYVWEKDRLDQLSASQQKSLDSLLVCMKGNWEASLSFGKWYFAQSAKSTEDELFTLPSTMNSWQASCSWYPLERLAAEIDLGLIISRDVPPNPGLGSILAGEGFELEGSGAGFFPIAVGMKYEWAASRLRPFVGLSNGVVFAQSRYTLAEGSLFSGITRSDYRVREKAWFGKIKAGAAYRSGAYTRIQLNVSYSVSTPFEESVGGYLLYEGLEARVGFAIVIPKKTGNK